MCRRTQSLSVEQHSDRTFGCAALIGESISGKGPLGQIGLETGIPLSEAEPLLLFSIVFTLFAAINEGRGRFVDES